MIKSFIDVFFPKVCSGCKVILLGNEKVICTKCRHEIPVTQFHKNKDNDAFKKFYGRIPVEHVSSIMYFHKKGIVQEMIYSLKYRGQEQVGDFLGHWYAEDLKDLDIIKNTHFIIPVPLHKKKLRKRGFNQVSSFGMALSQNLDIPFDENLLLRKTDSKTQSKKNFSERTIVSDTIFDVTFNETHHDKHFLLIDDVLTTGATLENCGRAILKIPGAKLSIVTMAYSHS